LCGSCEGTGVFIGNFEPEGVGNVCWTCKGTGNHKIEFDYTPFTERKTRTDVKTVRMVGQSADAEGHPVSYDEFLAGKMPI
ncbi:MAG TPA: hypothetical protein VI874_04035, partial [Candidatus Norongarragalinales archaeon]|nr:hypothetical protein [Candidatus Norongarragalinales archaeon]